MKKKTINNTVSKLFCSSALALLGIAPMAAHACGDTPLMGEICTFAFNFCPQGFVPADGRLLQVNQYQALFSLLSNTFGGDGRSTFGVPDLRGRVAVGTGQGTGVAPIAWGKMDGGTVTLNASNMPPQTLTGTAQFASGSIMNGTLSLPVTGGTVSGQTIGGTVTVNALNGDASPTGGKNIPDSAANTVGKTGGSNNFYPQGSNPVAVPTSVNLTVSGGTISGANASGNVALPATNINAPVTVASQNSPTSVTITPARVGLSVCIATSGLYPTRP